MIRTALGLALSAALVSACATAPRLDSPLASPRGAAPVGFPTSIRTETTDMDFLKEDAVVHQQALAKASDRTVDLLALSGGGAGGAFGAGVLIGLPTLRLRGDYLAIVTLGFGAAAAAGGATGRGRGGVGMRGGGRAGTGGAGRGGTGNGSGAGVKRTWADATVPSPAGSLRPSGRSNPAEWLPSARM